jgi:hypothetical protein
MHEMRVKGQLEDGPMSEKWVMGKSTIPTIERRG